MSALEHILGPRPRLTLVVEESRVVEIWVDGRAPLIGLHDYDWGETDRHASRDEEGFPFTPINWKGPAWALGLSLYPPEQETNPMAQPALKTIPIEQLHISKLNMRHSRKAPDVSDILPSIRERGIRQTLLVRPEGEGYGVVAGRRRFHALQVIAAETGKSLGVPCAIMEADDDAAAVEASLIENVARLPATEMEQYNAFGKLAHSGRTVEEIAGHFGVTDLKVRRILALANLSSPIRALYAKDDIDPETVRALTLATKDQQADWLALFRSETERAPMGRACKAWITGGSTITTDKALFDLASYEGEVTADLFGETGVFADADTFWKAQSAAVAAKVEAYVQAGWRDVQVLERGKYFASWEHVKRPRTKGGSVIVEVRHDGNVTFHEGYITQAEARRQDKRARPDGDADAVDAKPEMSGPLAEYIGLHRHGAARARLLDHPAIALRLMVAHAMTGSVLWDVRRHELTTRREDTRTSVEGSVADARMTEAQEGAASLFTALGVNGTARRNGDEYRLCEVFSALLAMSDEDVSAVLAFVMADTLAAGGGVVEAVAHVTDTDMATYWKPEPAFFDLLRDKRAVNAMVSDIASPSTAEASLTDTAKVQKQLIGNRITGEGCEAKADWRPGWMQVPPVRLVSGAASAPADAWARIAGLFEASAEDSCADDSHLAEPHAA
jgi:ParB family chromosome partitioning protein